MFTGSSFSCFFFENVSPRSSILLVTCSLKETLSSRSWIRSLKGVRVSSQKYCRKGVILYCGSGHWRYSEEKKCSHTNDVNKTRTGWWDLPYTTPPPSSINRKMNVYRPGTTRYLDLDYPFYRRDLLDLYLGLSHSSVTKLKRKNPSHTNTTHIFLCTVSRNRWSSYPTPSLFDRQGERMIHHKGESIDPHQCTD